MTKLRFSGYNWRYSWVLNRVGGSVPFDIPLNEAVEQMLLESPRDNGVLEDINQELQNLREYMGKLTVMLHERGNLSAADIHGLLSLDPADVGIVKE